MSLQKRSKNCLYPLYSFTHQCVEPEIPVNARSEPSRMMPIGNFANESRVFIYSYAHVSCSRLSFRARVSRFALASCSRLVLASCSPHARVSFRARISRFALASRARFVLASCSPHARISCSFRARASCSRLISCSHFSIRARVSCSLHARVSCSFRARVSHSVLASRARVSRFALAPRARVSFRARFMLAFLVSCTFHARVSFRGRLEPLADMLK